MKEGEKERIERDKALKRMKSQRELGNPSLDFSNSWNRNQPLPTTTTYSNGHSHSNGFNHSVPEEEDYGRQINGTFSNSFGGDGTFSNGSLGNGTSFGGIGRSLGNGGYAPSAVEVSFSSTAEIYGDDGSESSLESKHGEYSFLRSGIVG